MVMGLSLFLIGGAGIIALFTLKYYELKGRVLMPQRAHMFMDAKALALKGSLSNSRGSMRKVLPIAHLISRYLVHQAALKFARFANFLESQAHSVADRVSHKHSFQRRDSKSEFLHQVSKIRNSNFEK